MIFLDNSKLYLRLWDRAEPQSAASFWLPYSEPDVQTWRFHNWVNQSGGVFLDDYVEMNVYQLSFNNVTTSHDLYNPLPSPFNTYKDLEIAWTYQTSQQNWSYEGEGSPARGSATYSFYDTASQGNAQYGNLTHAVQSFWDDATHAFSDYRVAWSRFYPNPTGNLVGLPGYTNQYGCPAGSADGGCRSTFSTANSNLLSSQIYIYDNHGVTFSTPPSEGKLTNERTLLRFDGTNPKYADSAYHYDTWGNRDTVTVYTV